MTPKVWQCSHPAPCLLNPQGIFSRVSLAVGKPTATMETGARNKHRRNPRAILLELEVKNTRVSKWYILAAAGGGRREGEVEESTLFASSCTAEKQEGELRKERGKPQCRGTRAQPERTRDRKGGLEAVPMVRGTVALPDGGSVVIPIIRTELQLIIDMLCLHW